MAVPRRWREKKICKWTNKWLFKKQSILRSLCIMQQKHDWPIMKRAEKVYQWCTVAQDIIWASNAWPSDISSLQRGKKKNLIFVGWRGKKGRSWSLRTVFSWNSLGTLHLVSVSRTPFWPISLYGISCASHHHICSKMFPFTPHYNSVLEKLTIEIMLQTEKSHLSTWAYAAFSQVKPPLGLTVTCWCKE